MNKRDEKEIVAELYELRRKLSSIQVKCQTLINRADIMGNLHCVGFAKDILKDADFGEVEY